MPTTTNFGWTTPADTDLVKDGAAAIRTLGSNIDTSLVDLKGGTTGQFLQKNSGTDLDYIWADVAAGAMTLISTTTLTGASTVLSSIPQTYKDLYIIIRNYLPANDGTDLNMRFNNDSTASRHGQIIAVERTSGTFNRTNINISADNDNSVGNGLMALTIPDYTNTATWKSVNFNSLTVDPSTTANWRFNWGCGIYNQTAAISSLGFLTSTGNLTSGTILLYGVK